MSQWITLVGNPNAGKTTLYNALTGERRKVGNWSGVTIDRAESLCYINESSYKLVDLPGLYALTAFSPEEAIAVSALTQTPGDVIINLVDGCHLERHLFLTLQLFQVNRPIILVVNMLDELKISGKQLDLELLSKKLGIPVVGISAAHGQGLDMLKQTIEDTLNSPPPPSPLPETPLTSEDAEGEWIQNAYQFIDDTLSATTQTQKLAVPHLSTHLDVIFTNRWLGIPLFLLMMYLVFSLTFGVGGILVEGIDYIFSEWISAPIGALLTFLQVSEWLISLITDGIIGGVGGVLTFLPNILLLFLALALLEDTGYMARVAYITDRLMSRIGLNGKAIVPMIMGFGCNAPAIMSTRILENPNDRMIALLINPFMSCGARLPIYILLSSVFFKGYESMVTFSLYLMGLVVAIASALLFKHTLFKSDSAPFLMELPPYRLPSARNVWLKVKDQGSAYLYRAGTLIFLASMGIWFLLAFGPEGYGDLTQSYGKQLGNYLAPILAPSGFGNWQAALSLITGVIAKEIVVSNMIIIFGLSANTAQGFDFAMQQAFTPLSAYAFMVFSLLYTPCIAVIGIIRSETSSWKWPVFSILYQLMVAWGLSAMVYQIGSWFFH